MTRVSPIGPAWWITAAILVASGSLAFSSRVTSSARLERVPAMATPASEAAEMALAITAAPATLTADADVYVWRDGHFAKARTGSTGVACLVSRDARVDGVFPMCFDPEGARTLMLEEMMKTELYARHLADTTVQRQVTAAYTHGTLVYPTKPAIIYMMSSRQLLTTTDAKGTHLIGAWRPHVMIYLPHATAAQFALGSANQAGPVSVPFEDAGGAQMVVEVPHWVDSRASPDSTRM
jgi:hypothetical protein